MSALPLDDAGLSIEPITAWRVWKLARVRGRLQLMSVTRDGGWGPVEPVRATCPRGTHRAPSESCTCGLYGAATLSDLRAAGAFGYGGSVLGTFSAWGNVVEHRVGVRAELAYPQRLRLVCAACLGASTITDPWVVTDTGSGLEAACRSHAPAGSGGYPAAMIQDELLGTYAVDLLPAQVTPPEPHRARRTAVKVLHGVAAVILNIVGALFALWAFGGFVVVGVAIVASVVTGVLRFVGVMEPAPEVPAVAAATPWPTFDPLDLLEEPAGGVVVRGGHPRPQPEPPPRARFGFVCGVPEGTTIRQVECGPDVPLWGFADDIGPTSFDEACVPGAVSISRTPDWTVCWHPAGDEPVEVPLHTTTTNPFRGGG